MPQAIRSGVVSTWLRPQFLPLDEGEGVGLPATPQPPAVAGRPPSPPPGDAIPQMALADLLKCEDVVDHTKATSSPSLALHALANIALDNVAPLAGPPTPKLPVPEDANTGVALPMSPLAMDANYRLPAPVRQPDPLAACIQTPLSVTSAALEGAALDPTASQEVQGASGG